MNKRRVYFKNKKAKKIKDKKLSKISTKSLSMILFTIGLLIFFLSIYKGDKYWKILHNYLHGLFGWCAILLGPMLIYISAIIITGKFQKFTKVKLLQSTILILALCSFIQMKIYDTSNVKNEDIADVDLFFEVGIKHKGGGLIVGLITWVLINNLGLMGSEIFIFITILMLFMFIFDITLIDLSNCIKKFVKLVNKLITKIINKQSSIINDNASINERSSVNDHKKKLLIYKNTPELGDFVDLYKDTDLVTKDEKHVFKQKKFLFENISEFQTISDGNLCLDVMTNKIDGCSCDNTTIKELHYLTPNITCLDVPSPINRGNLDEELKNTASKLIKTLKNFGVIATILDVSHGPSVTRYGVQPSVGVKVNRITGLADDIALNLATTNVRIEAPIPNKAIVGIEVPNKIVSIVNIREIIDSQEFKNNKSDLTIALGKDISGKFVIVDVSKMSHVLIAGSTGSGKSVCINSIIISLIYKSSPEDVKLLMIDPKVVELGMYDGIPHLLVQVVTDHEKVAGALSEIVNEMYKRYENFAKKFVRDINEYNKLMEAEGLKKLHKIVVIIDELADLMTNDVENLICKLAQMARAAGIHLIIATQRPSVNVITGIIKANIPSRIAFAVSSQVDSRTIIDSAGAEKLLGKGDMLFWPAGENKPLRVQGCFVSSEEVKKVVSSFNSKIPACSLIDTKVD